MDILKLLSKEYYKLHIFEQLYIYNYVKFEDILNEQ
jgi:hypothetical protein